MKRKAFTAAMLAAALLLALVGCGRKETPQTQPAELPTEQETASPAAETAVEEPWMAALAEELFQKYGVLPEYYEDLGGGIYMVYVEVGGEIMLFGTVDAETHEFHME